MFEEGILIGNRSLYDNSHVDPLHININLSKVKIYLHDGYDWKDTRKGNPWSRQILKQHKQHKQWLREGEKA